MEIFSILEKVSDPRRDHLKNIVWKAYFILQYPLFYVEPKAGMR